LARLNQAQTEQPFTRNASLDMKVFSVKHVIQDISNKIIHILIAFHAKINLTFQNMWAEL
jgi:hypothetical protein